MRYLPIELDVQGREALVVGASAEVVAKVERLLAAGARVVVVAPGEVDPVIEAMAADGRLALARREPLAGDVDGKAIVFVATTEEGRAAAFHARGLAEGRLVCTLDRPELSTFVNPAVARAAGLSMTFATGGTSPGAVRRIREDLEALFGDPRFARFLEGLAGLRARLPRGERAVRMAEAVKGFAVEARLRFPAWVERGEEP
ncbi:precorrin-2 dehydrogenase/sirohydrochlorin ferrochelatase family protein [Polyangium jinanense]|uniref:precorrin-2 dehydrogenase n=1 Tax=Polyangium jinanense TaxID=2829994 RepID=A0A9X4AXZ0_9BACT|nr:NAD(P)-dependent oxidoreductase [Polyangium jinanense]MDC3960192.1 bifunctional precorrin-2 dehydrogenase/sirohydrochlorin ferrochelatase [Polyangium jinanense]MDC3986632.1 bifunctional precorrin-2 dehydrogenase/sirohydrochlorin ferrochelatase [Polyangium jinanense]